MLTMKVFALLAWIVTALGTAHEEEEACFLQRAGVGASAAESGGVADDKPAVFRPIVPVKKPVFFPKRKQYKICPDHGPPPELVDWRSYTEKGNWIQIGELNVYMVGRVLASKSAIILAHDVYGVQKQVTHVLAIADALAQYGYLVVVPDYFRGGGLFSLYQVPGNSGVFPKRYLQQFDFPTLKRQTFAVVDYLRKKRGVEYIGMAGYCWGAWLIARISKFKGVIQAAVWAHPTIQVCSEVFDRDVDTCQQEIAKKVKVPTLIMPSWEEQPIYADGEISDIIRGNGYPSKALNFSDNMHGWMPRRASFGIQGNDYGMQVEGVPPVFAPDFKDGGDRLLPKYPCVQDGVLRGIAAHVAWFGKYLNPYAPKDPYGEVDEKTECKGLPPNAPALRAKYHGGGLSIASGKN